MLSIIKQSLSSDESNPICKFFQLTRHAASAGPEMAWKIYDAQRISDGQYASVFLFEKKIADKLHKPKRREAVTEILRREVRHLEEFKHPRFLKVIHPLEECNDSLAFACESVIASVANKLGNHERAPNTIAQDMKALQFTEIEVKFGVLQLSEALNYLHNVEQLIHGNVCPQSIVITKRGTWKLAGLGFVAKATDGKDSFPCIPWNQKAAKMTQPDLDFIAPEIQIDKTCTNLADMFSLGMVVCALYNGGKSLLESQQNPTLYVKKVNEMHNAFSDVAQNMPLGLVEPIEKMIQRDIRYRPTPQQFTQLKYFNDAVVQCLFTLEMMDSRDKKFKTEFLEDLEMITPEIPKKLLYRHVFPRLCQELKNQDLLLNVIPVFIAMTEVATHQEFAEKIYPGFKQLCCMQRPVQATVLLLDNLDIVLAKMPKEEIKTDILPIIMNMLDSNSLQGQEAAIATIGTIGEYLDDSVMRKTVLPKAKSVFIKATNPKMRMNALACIDRLLDSIDKMIILDEVLPFLTDVNYQDTEVLMAVIGIYKHMLSDKKFGLTHNLIATKVMPPLIPYTVHPGLTMEQFSQLIELLQEMLSIIDKQRRNKMKIEGMNYNTPCRQSIKMHRHSMVDKPRLEELLISKSEGYSSQSVDEPHSNKQFLSVDDEYIKTIQKAKSSPGTPEVQASRKQFTYSPTPQRRHSSIHGIQPTSCKSNSPNSNSTSSLREISPRSRRKSFQCRDSRGGGAHDGRGVPDGRGAGDGREREQHTRSKLESRSKPEISVDACQLLHHQDPSLLSPPSQNRRRRSSTSSLGPLIVPDQQVKESRSGMLDAISPNVQRKASFSSLGESVVQFFATAGKT
ncbi:unnamed protein product [Owenia fusiformis]|uniref:Uncharacterized protein n=1 Tax=Owenia fusiformis TaxID=6347 RepID=A0A8J1TRS1_OWEFU|nr:unnamed protein product [Owenia fusiformis]